MKTVDGVTYLDKETTYVSCKGCGKKMRIRSSWSATGKTYYARLECTRCGGVLAATIKPAVIVSVREIERRKPPSGDVSTQRHLFNLVD